MLNASNQSRTDYIALEELLTLPNYYLPVANPNGSQVAYFSDQTRHIELYLIDLQTRRIKQLSRWQAPVSVRSGFCWSTDGSELIYGRDAAGDEKHDLFALNITTGETRQLTHDPEVQEFPIESSPDGKWFSVLGDKSGQRNLWKLSRDGAEYIQLTDYANPVLSGGYWSPDGRLLAFNVNLSTDMLNFDGYIIAADGSQPAQKVFSVRDGTEDLINSWHPSGKILAVTSDASGVHRAGLLYLETGQIQWLTEAADQEIDESARKFSKDGKWLYCDRNFESQMRSVIYSVETGERRELKMPPGTALATDWVLQDKALLVYFTAENSRPERGLYWIEEERYESLLPAHYGKLKPTQFVSGQHIYYPSFDEKSIPALLYHPHRLPTTKKLAAVVVAHGGPTDQFYREFDPLLQLLVGQGYVVLEPNVRGSTGYGVEFRDAALLDWGGGDLEDIAAGAHYLKSLPYVDSERVAIFGGSYGGYLTYMALTKKPNLFKTGVAWVGITDLKELYQGLPGPFQYYLRQQLGDPEANAALWHERSAVNFAENMTATLLMLHGENDPRCPLSQADRFRQRLLESAKREGEDFELEILREEGHGSQDIEQKIRVYRLILDFLSRRL